MEKQQLWNALIRYVRDKTDQVTNDWGAYQEAMKKLEQMATRGGGNDEQEEYQRLITDVTVCVCLSAYFLGIEDGHRLAITLERGSLVREFLGEWLGDKEQNAPRHED